ncbi:hypothetical protein scyTo_0015353, partial [Scyliorhinus torazame]|nr:hypothetical protein [Scyliorhinus torazame]
MASPAMPITWMERFMDKVALVSVSTYRDRYLEELEKNNPKAKCTRPSNNPQ